MSDLARRRAAAASRRVNQVVLAATLILAVPAAAALIFAAASEREVAAAAIYGASLVACAFFSFAYHLSDGSRLRPLLRRLDHSAIFLLIAGTYTPFAIVLGEDRGFILVGAVWILAFIGMILKLAVGARWHGFFVVAYLALGWLALVDLANLVRALTPGTLMLLAAGGAAFSIGALVHWRNRSDWSEPVWHALVLVGCATHFAAVARVV